MRLSWDRPLAGLTIIVESGIILTLADRFPAFRGSVCRCFFVFGHLIYRSLSGLLFRQENQ